MLMGINPIGFVAALSVFVGVWLGHVFVRRIERVVINLWIPIVGALVLGLALLSASLATSMRIVSTALGILGVTVLWDALEFVRQEKRVKKGHAPANAENPRHAKILSEFQPATVVNVLSASPEERA